MSAAGADPPRREPPPAATNGSPSGRDREAWIPARSNSSTIAPAVGWDSARSIARCRCASSADSTTVIETDIPACRAAVSMPWSVRA